MSTQPNTQVNRQVSAYRAPMMPRLKAGLFALVLAGSLISPAHATGVPTVDGSAILTTLQQWYQYAQRQFSQMQSMMPGQIASGLVGSDKAKTQAGEYIKALQDIQTQMQSLDMCSQYKVQSSQSLCDQEYKLKLARINAYIVMMKDVQADYDALMSAVNDYNSTANGANVGDMMTGGGDVKTGQLATKGETVKAAQKTLSDHMEQHAQFIQSIESNIKMVHEVRLDVARLQFEGNSGSLSSVIDKAAVSATLMSAAAKYESDAQNKRENEQIQMGKTIKTGTNY